jgi:hypothetical protein
MKKFVLAAFCTVSLVSFVVADEFTAMITKVDGNKISYFKTKAAPANPNAAGGKKGGGFGGGFGGAGQIIDGDLMTTTSSASVKVVTKGAKKDDGTFEDPVAIEGGLTNAQFKSVKAGFTVTMTTADTGADKGNITQIMVGGGFGKGAGAGFGKGGKKGAGAGKGGN